MSHSLSSDLGCIHTLVIEMAAVLATPYQTLNSRTPTQSLLAAEGDDLLGQGWSESNKNGFAEARASVFRGADTQAGRQLKTWAYWADICTACLYMCILCTFSSQRPNK